MNKLVGIAVLLTCFLLAGMAQADMTINGAGASFPYPVYAKWAHKYYELNKVKVNYQSIGSGGGISQIKAKTVDFGGSDDPLKADELQKDNLAQFPTLIGGVVPVYNLPGIGPGEITLSPTVLADVFLGKITKWNDPAIAKLNPKVKLPADAITVVHRADGSGTTFIFTNYLSKVSPEWQEKVGNNKSVSWPVGVGAKGNEGVANNVKQVQGGIGYVEYAYAVINKIPYANLVNKAWPIAGATFILVQKQQPDEEKAKAMFKFFDWCYKHGDSIAEELHYVPIPDNVVTMIEDMWSNDVKYIR
jgi:phosphate transport system substrate-binding protein